MDSVFTNIQLNTIQVNSIWRTDYIFTCNASEAVYEKCGPRDENPIDAFSLWLTMNTNGKKNTFTVCNEGMEVTFEVPRETKEEMVKILKDMGLIPKGQMVIKYEATIQISPEDAKLAEEVLAVEDGYFEDYDEDATIRTFTAHFSDGSEADIKLCNGNTPWVDSVLFDQNGRQIALCDPGDSLFGEYVFEVDGTEYMVNVKE